jgi:hypothetical protein
MSSICYSIWLSLIAQALGALWAASASRPLVTPCAKIVPWEGSIMRDLFLMGPEGNIDSFKMLRVDKGLVQGVEPLQYIADGSLLVIHRISDRKIASEVVHIQFCIPALDEVFWESDRVYVLACKAQMLEID